MQLIGLGFVRGKPSARRFAGQCLGLAIVYMGDIVVRLAGEDRERDLAGRGVILRQATRLAPDAGEEERFTRLGSYRVGLLLIAAALPLVPPVGHDQATLALERLGEQLFSWAVSDRALMGDSFVSVAQFGTKPHQAGPTVRSPVSGCRRAHS